MTPLPPSQAGTLVFAYNADSGLFNAVTESAHKVLRPETYQCNLCQLTYGLIGMHSQWRAFLQSLDFQLRFLHRDELLQAYPAFHAPLPVIFRENPHHIDIVLGAEAINAATSLDELQQALEQALIH